MFDLSLAEVALIVVVVVVFIGPKELPAVLRGFAKAMRAIRGLYDELKQAFEELSKEAGLKESADAIRKDITLIQGDDGKYYESYSMPDIKRRQGPPPEGDDE